MELKHGELKSWENCENGSFIMKKGCVTRFSGGGFQSQVTKSMGSIDSFRIGSSAVGCRYVDQTILRSSKGEDSASNRLTTNLAHKCHRSAYHV